MQIRDALKSDLDAIAELLLIVHEMHVRAHPEIYAEISYEVAINFLANRLADEQTFLRVAEVDSQLQGYYCAAIRNAPSLALLKARKVLYVNELVVWPESRRIGIGQALFDDLKSKARYGEISEIELDVGCFNADAIRFFEKQGFETLRERMQARLDLS